ncbi:MAG: MMPL family transporter, partial [Pseudomonadota bacterium]
MLRNLARFCFRRRWLVAIGWIVLLAVLLFLNQTVGGDFSDEFDLPGTESQRALDILKEKGFGTRGGFSGQVVFDAEQGVTDPTVREAMESLFSEIVESVPDTSVQSPYSLEGQRQVAPDGRIAYAEVNFGDRANPEYRAASKQIHEMVDRVEVPGLTVELGGDVFVGEPAFSSEAFGFLAAMVILLIAFGSLLAMGLPIVTALFGIGTGVAVVGLAAHIVDMPSFSNQAMLMIAIGVGIDYALFIVTRYRESLHRGMDPEEATAQAMSTAGRAVLFAGTTVVIAILGLFLIGLALIQGLAVGIAIGVLTTMTASLTLLPAVLGFVGRNIDRLGLPHA